MKNYLRLKAWSFINTSYVFVDTAHLFYRKVFFEAGIKPKKIHEYHKPHSDLRLIECKVFKQDAKKLEEIFPEIRRRALLLGHKDYDEACEMLCKGGEVK